MDTRNRRLLHPILIYSILILLCVVSLCPFIVNTELPVGNDAELHVFRTAELGYSKSAGQVYPRWAPNFFHGYGYPIFNYYAPLSYHLGYWLSGCHPESAAVGTLFTTILAQCWGIFGAYLLGKFFSDQGGGLISAAVYAFSPYIQFINPHIRGDIAEVVALAFVPWTIWAWANLWRHDIFKARYFVSAIVFPALALLSHNLTGLITMILILAYSAAQTWRMRKKRHMITRAFLAGVTIIALTAFFWLPFLVERSDILLDVAGDGHYDYRNHFVPWVYLISALGKLDWRAATPNYPMSAGPINVLALVIGAIVWLWNRLPHRQSERSTPETGFFIAGSALLLFLVSQDSAFLWRVIPGIEFFQFPWRFLGPFAVMMIPVVATVATFIHRCNWRIPEILLTCLFIVLPLGLGAAGLFIRPWVTLPETIPSNLVIEYELKGLWRGTTSTNDFVPSTVDMIPGPQGTVIESYRQGQLDRVNRASLPEGVSVSTIADRPWINHYAVDADQDFILRLFLFAFPGWTATIDELPVDIEIAHPEGFITLQVPQGQHEIIVAFKDTPIRSLGWGISIVAGVSLIILALTHAIRDHVRASTPNKILTKQYTDQGLIIVFTLLIIAAILFTVKSPGMFYENSDIGEARVAEHQQQALLGDQIRLLGYDISHQQIPRGRVIEVQLFWQAEHPIDQTYQSFVHVVSEQGILIAQSDHLNPGGFPTNLWPTDRYIVDSHRITLPEDYEGDLQIHAGIFDLYSGERLPNINVPGTDYILLDSRISVN